MTAAVKRLLLKQRGDTIVEVMICAAVITSLLVGSYYSLNHSYQAYEATEEQSQGLKLVETQIEDLRSYFPSITVPTSANCFALNYDSVHHTYSISPSSSCTFQADGTAASANSLPTYTVSISPSTISLSPQTYTVTATWQSILGGNAKTSLEYNIL